MKLYNGATVLNVSEMPQGNINAEKGQIYLLQGDSYDWLKKIPENSIDSVVCDPPYLLNFMGKEFDRENGNPADHVEFWKLVLKTMKPGAHLLAAGIGRTHHRVMVAIEDAGFEIRDCIYHVFGSGFPKSHNIEKTLIKMGENEKAKEFAGFGTALKPAVEIWTLARKPLSEKTVALNVIKWGTGGINIDGCRVGTDELKKQKAKGSNGGEAYGDYNLNAEYVPNTQGRFPANFIHDGSDEVVGLFPESNSGNGKAKTYEKEGGQWGKGKQIRNAAFGDSGSASRFFKTCSPTLEYDTMSVCKHTNANNVELALITIRATIGNIAPLNVEDWLDERLVQNVKSVGIECQRCATSIAQELAKIRSLVFKNEELLATQDFIGNFKNSTPILNLASIVAIWENIGTTPTTQNLSQLFGSVLLAIDENTSLDTKEKAEQKSEHASFAYFPKASKRDRNEGLEGFEEKLAGAYEFRNRESGKGQFEGKTNTLKANNHPTVKPTSLMQYLVRLVTPKGGTVLDPFMGSGSTGKACVLEGFDFIGIEKDPEYCKIAEARIEYAVGKP